MTLVLALVGRDNAVLAADGKLTQGSSGGYYASSVQKLKLVNQGNWILGVAVSQVGYDLAKYIEENGEPFPANIHKGVRQYAVRMCSLYREHGYRTPTALMVAGCGENDAAIYGFNIAPEEQIESRFWGTTRTINQSAIGADTHGAMYFSHAFHSPEMSIVQRISIAHLCVSETCKQDPRVGPPVEIGLVRVGKAPKILDPKQLESVQARSSEIANEIRNMVMSSNPQIPDLLP